MEVNLTSTFFNFSDFYNPVESKNYKKVHKLLQQGNVDISFANKHETTV